MKSKYEIFDRSRLSIKLLAERVHDMHLADVLRLEDPTPAFSHPQFPELARRIVAAKRRGAARLLMMGAHVIKAGMNRHIHFLIFAHNVEALEGSVLLSFGSAIMGPEVHLKALAMARNVAHQEGRSTRDFTTAVFDLVPIQGDIHHELSEIDPGHYFRPHKTILVRTVAEGGTSFYFCGDHRATVPALGRALLEIP